MIGYLPTSYHLDQPKEKAAAVTHVNQDRGIWVICIVLDKAHVFVFRHYYGVVLFCPDSSWAQSGLALY